MSPNSNLSLHLKGVANGDGTAPQKVGSLGNVSQPWIRWVRFFYQTTCQSTLTNGYEHIKCDLSDYLVPMAQASPSGQYFTPELKLPKELGISTMLQVAGCLPV